MDRLHEFIDDGCRCFHPLAYGWWFTFARHLTRVSIMHHLFRITVLLCTCVPAQLLCQSAAAAPPDFLRSIGKMYVVVAVIVVVFIGLALYLWRLDRRLTRIEEEIEDHA